MEGWVDDGRSDGRTGACVPPMSRMVIRSGACMPPMYGGVDGEGRVEAGGGNVGSADWLIDGGADVAGRVEAGWDDVGSAAGGRLIVRPVLLAG